jgi:hypothetical protein
MFLFKNGITRKPYHLNGFMLKVSYLGKQGYVFSGYTSKMPYIKVTPLGAEEMETYLARNFEKPKTKIKKSKDYEVSEYAYANGNRLTTEYGDGCYTETMLLNHITYAESLLFYEARACQGDAIDDPKIKIMVNGATQISWYSCD